MANREAENCFPDLNEKDYHLPTAVTDTILSPTVVVHMDKVR